MLKFSPNPLSVALILFGIVLVPKLLVEVVKGTIVLLDVKAHEGTQQESGIATFIFRVYGIDFF